MKISFIISFTILSCANINAQYFKNLNYFVELTYHQQFIYTYDSLTLIGTNNGTEYYKLKKYLSKTKKLLNTLTFKISNDSILFKLDNNVDTNYYTYFNLNLKKSDTLNIGLFDFEKYFLFNDSNLSISTKSCIIKDTGYIVVSGFKYKYIDIVDLSGNYLDIFYDSIGFSGSLISLRNWIDYKHLICVCSGNEIIYTTTHLKNICNIDTFNKFYSTLNYILNQKNNIQLIPNPSSTSTTVKSENGQILEIVLHNCIGQNQDINKEFGGEFVVLDLSNLASGIYFVRITTTNGVFFKSLLKPSP